nr:immunoglobulin heavy chain junction region [Macaca mulatta]MOY22717.1 immunoglobulin heavy chain junction region [Macaca mulatta]MOY22788.1 immunoglobulin heavy chain junction region [Macaca mulatta]MOY22827.1 immunoglobulin heavy chain junction region [Macaca mulatta]MOY23024.1 immunoglobulin heavy chain junction region [Macaca mulatta]
CAREEGRWSLGNNRFAVW